MGVFPPSDDGAPGTYHRGRRSRKPAFALAALLAVAAWGRWRPFSIEVDGSSMRPTLEPGDWALARRLHSVRVGDVVVVEHPGRPGFEVVKRVIAVPGEGRAEGRALDPGQVWVQGDSADASTDSRSFGPITAQAVRGKVILVWWPPARWRRV